MSVCAACCSKNPGPTHVFLSDSQHVEISACHFLDGTFCIGADGQRSRHILIDGCTWTQDRAPGRMWSDLEWFRIHGAGKQYPKVDIERDWRLFDGDFFRSTSIAGGVTIRNCHIRAAFNAIHGYNGARDLRLNRDFHIHDNIFEDIRDNAIDRARGCGRELVGGITTAFGTCTRPFSYQLGRSEYLYLFSNLFDFDSIQGPDLPDSPYELNRGGGIFKLERKPKNVHPPHGPFYVFHNSLRTRSDYLRKGIAAGLVHRNNAIECVPTAGPDFNTHLRIFGDPARSGPQRSALSPIGITTGSALTMM